MPTITPTNGYSPAAQALAANQKTLATMGPLPAGQQQVADAAVSSGSAAADTLAQAPQTLQQAGQTLSGQAGFGAVGGQYDDVSKQYQLFLHDMQLSGSQPPGTTTPPPAVGGPPPTTPAMIGNPVDTGAQLGMSNPYAGEKYLSGGLDAGTAAVLKALKSVTSQNVGQYGNTFGAINNILKSQNEQVSSSSDILKNLLDEAQKSKAEQIQQSQFSQQMALEKVKETADLISKGLLNPDGSAITATNTSGTASNNPTDIRSSYLAKWNAATTPAMKDDIAKAYKSATGDTLIADPFVAQQAQSLLDDMKSGKLVPSTLWQGLGINVMGMDPLRDPKVDQILSVISQINGISSPTEESKKNYLPYLKNPALLVKTLQSYVGAAPPIGQASQGAQSSQAGGVMMRGPDGRMGTVHQSEVNEATQNGWKAVGGDAPYGGVA